MRLPVLGNPANAVSASITGRDYLSHSQVTTFQMCPLRWWFHYVAQLPREHLSAGLVFGQAIHAAIEAHHQFLLTGDAEMSTLENLLRAYDEAWALNTSGPIAYGKDEDAASLRDKAAGMLSAFLDDKVSRPAGEIIAIEEQMRSTIGTGIPDLLARLDLLFVSDNAVVIRDFKTSRCLWDDQKVAEATGQLLLYAALARPITEALTDDGIPIRLEFVVLTKTKVPRIQTLTVRMDVDALARTKAVIRQVWQAMARGHVYPNPSPMHCASCPFTQACRQWSA